MPSSEYPISETEPTPKPQKFMQVTFEAVDDPEMNCMLAIVAVLRTFDLKPEAKARISAWAAGRINEG